jgi:hypothetical protein
VKYDNDNKNIVGIYGPEDKLFVPCHIGGNDHPNFQSNMPEFDKIAKNLV